MTAYYNDTDSYVCAWLRNLIDAGHITPGDVDERSIADVQPDDLRGYDRCHFFAGIGGWELAFNIAGWTGPVWTGSCPCQPFSTAGKRRGAADARHLWPEFRRLIAECRPPTVFGEQVAGPDGRVWLSRVRADLEGAGYAVGAADLPAACAGAPHKRQRLFFVADAGGEGRGARRLQGERRQARGWAQRGADGLGDAESRHERRTRQPGAGDGRQGAAGGPGTRLGDADRARPQGRREHVGQHAGQRSVGPAGTRLPDAVRDGREQGAAALRARQPDVAGDRERVGESNGAGRRARFSAAEAAGFWSAAVATGCADGKTRRVGAGVQPLAHGIPGRVGQLRAYGNAIVPQVAAEFVAAYMECRP